MKTQSRERRKRNRRASAIRQVERLEGRQLLSTMTEYPLPSSIPRPTDVALGSDGNLWFAETNANQIGRITPSGTVTEFSLPDSSNPDYITSGSDGNLWFTNPGNNTIGEMTTASVLVNEYTVPTGSSGPSGITAGPDGNLWFAEQNGNKIGKITTAGVITEYTNGDINGPYELAFGSDGNLWFTEINNDEIGKLVVSGVDTGLVTLYPTSIDAGPRGIIEGSDGNLWFTEGGLGQIGKITTTGILTEYSLPTGSNASEITSVPGGNLFFSDDGTNAIGEITTSGTFISDYEIPTGGSAPDGLTVGPNDSIWFTEFIGDQVGSLTFSIPTTLSVTNVTGTYGGGTNLSATLTAGDIPISGETVDFKIGGTDVGTAITGSNGVASLGNASLSGLSATTYTNDITASFAGDSSYQSGAATQDLASSSGSASLTITPAPLVISVNNLSKVYGHNNPTLTGFVSGVIGGDSVTVNYATDATQYSDVVSGGYAITVTGLSGAQAIDYSTTVSGALVTNGALTVTPAPLNIRAFTPTKVYGTTNPPFYAIPVNPSDGVLNTDDVEADYSTTASQYSGVVNGGYTLTFTGLSGPKLVDYSTTVNGASSTNGTLTVTPAPLHILTSNLTKVYGSANPNFNNISVTAGQGALRGDDVEVNYSTRATQYSDVTDGGYPITFTGLSGAQASDYSGSIEGAYVTTATLTVTPAPLNIPADNLTKVYGSANPTITNIPVTANEGALNGDDVEVNYSTRVGQYTDVNNVGYWVNFTSLSGAKAVDYSTAITGASVANGTLTITPAPLTYVVDELSKVYGQNNPTLTGQVSGILDGDNVVADYTTSASQYSNVVEGGYPITISGLSGSKAVDYSTTINGASVTNGTLTVTPAPLTVLVASQSKVYGQANPIELGLFGGVLNGDNVGVTYGSSATQYSNVVVGGYPIFPTGITGSKAEDYSLSVQGSSVTDGTLTIAPTPVVVVINNLSKSYGQVNPTLTATVAGLLNGDAVIANLVTTANLASNVVTGGYPINVTGLSGPNAGDYTISSSTAGTLTVTPAPLFVAGGIQSKVYGQANPAFTVSYGGFVLGQGPSSLSGTLQFSTTATTASHVLDYFVTPTGLTSSNYAIQFVNGGLAITPAPLVITAPSLFTTYGQAVPALTPSYSGFVNGDTAAKLWAPVSFATTLQASSPVGFYSIIPQGATSPDYVIQDNFGIADVIPALLVATPSSGFAVSGQPLPAFTVSYSGFVNGDTAAVLTTPATISTPATSSSAPGFYPVLASGASATNYTIVNYFGIVDILAAPLPPPLNPGQVAFVTSLYANILGRAPENSAVAGWITELNDGVTRASVAQQIYNSPEAVGYRAVKHQGTISLASALADAQFAQSQAS